MQTEDIKSFMPKQEAVDDFKRHRELFLKRTAWSSPCRSWFKGGTVDGPIMMWPGSRIHFFDAMANPRWEVRLQCSLKENEEAIQTESMLTCFLQDYDWVTRLNNRFSFFGNGFSKKEVDGSDITWYIEGV
jgi:hypothetical protein